MLLAIYVNSLCSNWFGAAKVKVLTPRHSIKMLSVNTLPPNISMHILHTVLYTFQLGVDKENLLINQEPLQ